MTMKGDLEETRRKVAQANPGWPWEFVLGYVDGMLDGMDNGKPDLKPVNAGDRAAGYRSAFKLYFAHAQGAKAVQS